MSGSNDTEIACKIVSKPAIHYIEAYLPTAYVNHINEYIDRVRESADDYSGELVGQINRSTLSAQRKLDLGAEVPKTLGALIVQVGSQLVQYIGATANVAANDMWTIHSYAGDYNPMHDHGANTFAGLSSILYLKVPAAIAEKKTPEGSGMDLTHASGAVDGFTQFVWGTNGITDLNLLRLPTQQFVKPEAGKLIVFPNWMLHSVHPFSGDGERRTLSCNMDVRIIAP